MTRFVDDLAVTTAPPVPAHWRSARKSPIPNLIVLGSLLLSGAVALLVATTLAESYDDAWTRAERSSENLAQAAVAEIDRNLGLHGFAMRQIAAGMRDPLVADDPVMLRRVLTTTLANSDHLSSLLVADANGEIVASADIPSPPPVNLSDRDYFIVQRDHPGSGLHLSRPLKNRLREGAPGIALSLRLSGTDGSFRGVVVAVLPLAYFHDLFTRLDGVPGERLVLVRTDGIVLMRLPSDDGAGDTGYDLSASSAFRRALVEPDGSYVETSQFHDAARLYSHASVPGFPLIVFVSTAIGAVLEDWWRKAMVIGVLTAIVCVGGIGSSLMLRREMIRRSAVEEMLSQLSATDGLTGIANRRHFDTVLAEEWRRARRANAPLALLMIDADDFKQLNDRHGHACGDDYLRTIARLVDGGIRRPGDLAARFGGEEFAAILPATDAAGAAVVAETIRARVEQEAAKPQSGGWFGTTVSVGVAATVPTAGGDLRELIASADRALYRAKANGRNRVVVEPSATTAPDVVPPDRPARALG